MEQKQSVFMVERTTFQFKGRNCYSYFITGMLRGKPVKAKGPTDKMLLNYFASQMSERG